MNKGNNLFICLCGASGGALWVFNALGMQGYRETLKLIVGRLNGLVRNGIIKPCSDWSREKEKAGNIPGLVLNSCYFIFF